MLRSDRNESSDQGNSIEEQVDGVRLRKVTVDDVKVRSKEEENIVDLATVERLARLTGMKEFVGSLLGERVIVPSHGYSYAANRIEAEQLSPSEARAAQIVLGAMYKCLGDKLVGATETVLCVPIIEDIDVENTALEIANETLITASGGKILSRLRFAGAAFSEGDLHITWGEAQ